MIFALNFCKYWFISVRSFAISVNIKHVFVRLNSAVFKVFICENRKLTFLCLNIQLNVLLQHLHKNPKWTAMRHSHMVNVLFKHEHNCLDTFYFCWVYKLHFHNFISPYRSNVYFLYKVMWIMSKLDLMSTITLCSFSLFCSLFSMSRQK